MYAISSPDEFLVDLFFRPSQMATLSTHCLGLYTVYNGCHQPWAHHSSDWIMLVSRSSFVIFQLVKKYNNIPFE